MPGQPAASFWVSDLLVLEQGEDFGLAYPSAKALYTAWQKNGELAEEHPILAEAILLEGKVRKW